MSDEMMDDQLVGAIDVSGRILDAVTGVAIQGVYVSLLQLSTSSGGDAGTKVAETLSAADGSYAIYNVPVADDYIVEFDVDGYKNERYAGVSLHSIGQGSLDPVRLVSDDNAGVGQLGGRVSFIEDGSGQANVTLEFREGINSRSGEIIATARTTVDGRYQVDGIDYGNVTATIGGEGIRRSYATFQILGNILIDEQNITVSPADAMGETLELRPLRIVLTWDVRPHDLDAHLTGPESDGQAYFHVFSGNHDAEAVNLTSDATLGEGPESIEIDRQRTGVYRYSVFNFSGDVDRPLEQSGARVEVFSGDSSLAQFTVPAGAGNLWTVFDIDDGQIVTVDSITRLQNVLDYFPPVGRKLASAMFTTSGMTQPGADGY